MIIKNCYVEYTLNTTEEVFNNLKNKWNLEFKKEYPLYLDLKNCDSIKQ